MEYLRVVLAVAARPGGRRRPGGINLHETYRLSPGPPDRDAWPPAREHRRARVSLLRLAQPRPLRERAEAWPACAGACRQSHQEKASHAQLARTFQHAVR